MPNWIDVPLNKKLFLNVDETMLTETYAALENCFVTESDGVSKFPGLKDFCDLGNNADIYLNKFNNDLMACGADGQVFRVDMAGNPSLITGVPVSGGLRTSFARTPDGLMMAAGGEIIKFDGTKNAILSSGAPLSNYVGYIDGYLVACEKDSGRFQNSGVNDFTTFNPLDIFAISGADNINAMIITPFNQVIIGTPDSIEQWERYVGSTVPFYRRWAMGGGISEPGSLCFADNACWGLNEKHEFTRMSGQIIQSTGDDVQAEIEHRYAIGNLESLNRAWSAPCFIKGQKFIVFQSPEATNSYGTKGVTFVFDIRRGAFFEIFGWDQDSGVPQLWPGRSIFSLWGKIFVGGQGKIYELDPLTFTNDNQTQRAYLRTAHYDSQGTLGVNGVKLTMKRGVGTYTESPRVMFRSNPDMKGWSLWQTRELGMTGAPMMSVEFGAQGLADTWQFEIAMTDNAPFELRRMQLDGTKAVR